MAKLTRKNQQDRVRKTRDYDRFGFMGPNRDVNRGHIEKLKEAIEMSPKLTEVQPILVNEQMQIIDGQHRFMALEELKRPINYVVVPGLTINDARQMNVLHKGWRTDDYARSYALSGDKSYQNYLWLKDNFNLSHSVILIAIYGKDFGGMYADFRKGLLHVDDFTQTKKRLDMLLELAEVSPLAMTKPFGEAFMRIVELEGFDFEKFKKKLAIAGPSRLASYSIAKDYLIAFEDIYNYQISEKKRVRLY